MSYLVQDDAAVLAAGDDDVAPGRLDREDVADGPALRVVQLQCPERCAKEIGLGLNFKN